MLSATAGQPAWHARLFLDCFPGYRQNCTFPHEMAGLELLRLAGQIETFPMHRERSSEISHFRTHAAKTMRASYSGDQNHG